MPPRTSEGDGKGTARLAGGRWPVVGWAAKGACVDARSTWCRMAIPPKEWSVTAQSLFVLGTAARRRRTSPAPYRDGLRRQVSATTGIPDLDSVSFCTFFPRYLFGLLGQGARLTVSVPCSIQPAMQVSPSSLRLLFPAPLCSQAWNLNFLHLPICTLPVYFFFLSSR